MNKIKTEIQTITPKLAEYMLGKNMQNRNISQSHVEKLSSDIKSGRWIFNGDPIRFNGNKLIDGQHRLSAIIKANKPIESLVIYGIESKAIQTIDTGKARSLSCTLGIDGYSNTPVLASAIRTLNDYLRGSMDPQTISTSRGIEILKENDGLPEVVKRMESLRKGVSPISIGVISALHYLMQKIDPFQAEEFSAGLITGTGDLIFNGSPVLVLRERLITAKLRKPAIRHRDQAVLCIKAWNLIRKGKSVSCLRMPTTYKNHFLI